MTDRALIPGTMPGELLRDLMDERLLSVHPRPAGIDDATYLAQLEARGLAVHLPRPELAAGAYARAKARAVVSGAVVVVPYEPDERRPEVTDPEPFDYVAWRAAYDRRQREGTSPYDPE